MMQNVDGRHQESRVENGQVVEPEEFVEHWKVVVGTSQRE